MSSDTGASAVADPVRIADDRLEGAAQIAEFLYGDASKQNKRRVYYEIEHGMLPVGHCGRRLVASKRRLREHYERLTGGGPES